MKRSAPSQRDARPSIRQKENEILVPSKRRRRNGLETENRSHEVLCSSNGNTEPLKLENDDDPKEWEEGRMANEQVESLLTTKILGKSKFDLKSKNEQMTEYIKKLRTCIRHFLQVETAYILQLEQLRDQMKQEKINHEAFVLSTTAAQEELSKHLSEACQCCQAIEKRLCTVEQEKMELSSIHGKDIKALEGSTRDCQELSMELVKVKIDLKTMEEKVKSLQDINKRLSEYNSSLQDYNCKLQKDASSAAEENARTQREKLTILETLGAIRMSTSALQTKLDTTKSAFDEENKKKAVLSKELERIRIELNQSNEEKHKYQAQINLLMEENIRFRDFSGKSESEIESMANRAKALEGSYNVQDEQIKSLLQQLDGANIKCQTLELSVLMHKKTDGDRAAKISELQLKLSEAEQRINEGEVIRRKLHNTIQELKGNVRVFCRVRPFLVEDEDCEQAQSVVQYPKFGELVGRGIELVQAEGQKYAFSFDKVFGPEITQANVFNEISQLVQSALDGYKVCIFAYGQTGSGKTYTMLGQPEQSEHKGIIPRSLEQIFKSSQYLETQGWKFKIQASMLEIYNETIRDLLTISKADPQKTDAIKMLTIKHDSLGNTTVSDLTLVQVTNWKEVSALLHQAAHCRTVGKTAMNEQSSRSHCVFTLRISGVNERTEQQVHGMLNLVDLAGSERLSRSGATGERLKETQAINKSLSSLGDVILAIANKEQHVPYRNSRLTYLLQPCLGGDSKTLMFVNVAPDSKSLHETLCSLRFAAKVNACEIGIPRRQTSAPRNGLPDASRLGTQA